MTENWANNLMSYSVQSIYNIVFLPLVCQLFTCHCMIQSYIWNHVIWSVLNSSTFDKCILTWASTSKFNPPPNQWTRHEDINCKNLYKATRSLETNSIDKNVYVFGLWVLWTTPGFGISSTLFIIYIFSKLATPFLNKHAWFSGRDKEG